VSRVAVREMKRAVRNGFGEAANDGAAVLAQGAALQLLERSIRFGHGRLAVIRLVMAAQAGAEVSAAHWDYCRNAALASEDRSLQALYLQAVQAVNRSSGRRQADAT